LTYSNFGGALIEILWLPTILFVFSLLFYGIEKMLDKVKNNQAKHTKNK